VHLTVSGCLGPCVIPNVVLFIYQGSTVWFRSINSETDVVSIYDYIEQLLTQNSFSMPRGELYTKVFQRYAYDSVCAVEAEDPDPEAIQKNGAPVSTLWNRRL
jgi:cobaltochelatase CobN